MSNTKNTHKSNQYECLGKDTESSLGLNILWLSCGPVAGVAEAAILAMTSATFRKWFNHLPFKVKDLCNKPLTSD